MPGMSLTQSRSVDDVYLFLTGDNKFLMGDQPAEVDCAAFGQLVQLLYHTPDSCPGKVLLKGMVLYNSLKSCTLRLVESSDNRA